MPDAEMSTPSIALQSRREGKRMPPTIPCQISNKQKQILAALRETDLAEGG